MGNYYVFCHWLSLHRSETLCFDDLTTFWKHHTEHAESADATDGSSSEAFQIRLGECLIPHLVAGLRVRRDQGA